MAFNVVPNMFQGAVHISMAWWKDLYSSVLYFWNCSNLSASLMYILVAALLIPVESLSLLLGHGLFYHNIVNMWCVLM